MAPVSLLTAIDSTSHVHLIVGSNPLAAARCTKSIKVGAKPFVLAPETAELHYALQERIENGEVQWLKKSFEDEDLFRLGREEINGVVDAVFVTNNPRDPQNIYISSLCKRNRIPINVIDSPSLSTFSLLSTHTDGPLQIGITTNGHGCRLSARIRREVASLLPRHLGSACARLGTIRIRIQAEDHRLHQARASDQLVGIEEQDNQPATFNALVTDADLDTAKNRRIRWLGQISEYWPLQRLANITDADVENILKSYSGELGTGSPLDIARPSVASKKGRIILAGSGPGHPDLLTQATHKAILAADIILTDKLVPAGVLALIPRRTPVHIARKFPGNADAAQQELLSLGLAGLREGKTVLRLKQGDPFIYGRGGEEVAFFRDEGFGDVVTVLPGVTSALSAPLFAGIPGTHRGVADQVLICTGTGRKGRPTIPPARVTTQTVVFLMALHRISGLVADLTTHDSPDARVLGADGNLNRQRELWPLDTPCAVVERATCPDQRVIRTTLEWVAQAVEAEGSRPPGLLIVGKACEVLHVGERGRMWVVEDGLGGLALDGIDGLLLEEKQDHNQEEGVEEVKESFNFRKIEVW